MFTSPEYKVEKKFKGLLAMSWSSLRELNKLLKKLQGEVNNEELEMTIVLIEELPTFKEANDEKVLQYFSVVMLEVAYSLTLRI